MEIGWGRLEAKKIQTETHSLHKFVKILKLYLWLKVYQVVGETVDKLTFNSVNMLFWFHVASNSRFSYILDVKIFPANFGSCLTTRLSTLNPNRKLRVAWSAFIVTKWTEAKGQTEQLHKLPCFALLLGRTLHVDRLVHSKCLTNLRKFHARMQCERMFANRFSQCVLVFISNEIKSDFCTRQLSFQMNKGVSF